MTFSYFVTPQWLEEHLNDSTIRILDATIFFDIDEEEMLRSGRAQYESHHIPGAIEANLFQLSDPQAKFPFTVAKPNQIKQVLEELGVEQGSHVVVYDSGPQVGVDFSAAIWAARLAWQLLYAGFEKVSILEGGFDRWLAEKRPVSKEIKSYSSSSLKLDHKPKYLVSKEDVFKAMTDDQVLVIDALPTEQYTGTISPYGENRAGHIPSSQNLFYGNLADPLTGKLHNEETLRSLFNAIPGFKEAQSIIIYCGFGVAASWLFMVLKQLGFDQIAIYDGSLDEWTADPQCPLEI